MRLARRVSDAASNNRAIAFRIEIPWGRARSRARRAVGRPDERGRTPPLSLGLSRRELLNGVCRRARRRETEAGRGRARKLGLGLGEIARRRRLLELIGDTRASERKRLLGRRGGGERRDEFFSELY